MKIILVCCILVAVRCGLAQQNCIQEIDKVMQCKKRVSTSDDAKKIAEESRKALNKCLGSDSVTKCHVQRDRCQDQADSSVSTGPLKKQSDTDAAKCFTNTQQGRGGMPPPPPPGQGMPPPPNGPPPSDDDDDEDVTECAVPKDAKTMDCIENEGTKALNDLARKVDRDMKNCDTSLPYGCIPQNPAVGMCLQLAFTPIINATVTNYVKCMSDAGYHFSKGN